MCQRVAELRVGLAAVVGDLDADSVPLPEAPVRWEHFDAIERLASSAKTLLATRVEQSREWQRQGYRSAAEHLAAKGGTSLGLARAGLETSKRLAGLPATQAAMRKGALSTPQANTVSDAAAADPGAEAKLLDSAGRSSLGELRDECARVKAAADPDPDATHRRIHAGRCLRRFRDAEGAWNLSARGTIEAGAQVGAALDPLIEEIFGAARRRGERDKRETYAFDALVEMARRARGIQEDQPGADGPATDNHATATSTGGSASTAGGNIGTDSDSGVEGSTDEVSSDDSASQDASADVCTDAGIAASSHGDDGEHVSAERGPTAKDSADEDGPDRRSPGRSVSRQRRVQPTHLALLRLDLEALVRGSVQGEERCEITGIGPVPVSVARRLLGDSVLKLVLTNGAQVANVTHLGRRPNAAQRIALLWSQPSCSVQGCGAVRVEHDHRIPYAETHHTRLEETDPLCGHHHDLKTYEGWALVEGSGNRPMVPPGNPGHPGNGGNRAPPGDAPPTKPSAGMPSSEQGASNPSLFGDAA